MSFRNENLNPAQDFTVTFHSIISIRPPHEALFERTIGTWDSLDLALNLQINYWLMKRIVDQLNCIVVKITLMISIIDQLNCIVLKIMLMKSIIDQLNRIEVKINAFITY